MLLLNGIYRADQETKARGPATSIFQTHQHFIPTLSEIECYDVFINIVPACSPILPYILPIDPNPSTIIGTHRDRHRGCLIKVKLGICVIGRTSSRDGGHVVHGFTLHKTPM